MKRKFVALLCSFMFIFLGVSYASEYILISPAPETTEQEITEQEKTDVISVLLNGQYIDFTDENGFAVNPEIINGRTMVTMRKIFETFDMDVEWIGETRTAIARSAGKEITLQIDNEKAILNDGEISGEVTLDAAPLIIEGRTLVPVRFIAESLDLVVDWDSEKRTVIILDVSSIVERIKKEAPIFYNYLSELKDEQDSYIYDIEGTGTIKYTNDEDKSKNENLKVVLDGQKSKAANLIENEIKLKITGKGSLIDALKENKFNNFSINVVTDLSNLKSYMTSSTFEDTILEGHYTEMDINDFQVMLNSLLVGGEDIEGNLKKTLEETEVTVSSSNSFLGIIEMICMVANDDNFSVTGRRTKTYKLKFEDYLEFTIKVEDGIITEQKVEVDFVKEVGLEKVEVEFEITKEKRTSKKAPVIEIPEKILGVN